MTGTHIDELAMAVSAWARVDSRVRACFWYGGYGMGVVHPESDLDVALLLHADADPSALAGDLTVAMRGAGGVVQAVMIPAERRVTLWVGSSPTKVDVVWGLCAAELAWLADADDVPSPRLVSAWAQDGEESAGEDVVDLLARAEVPRDPLALAPRRDAAEGEADKFIIAFDACSAAHARSDAYAFYFHYNLALGRLFRLVQLTRAGRLHLYLPRNLLGSTMTFAEQVEYRRLAGSLSLPDGLDLKHALADRFAGVVREAQDVLGVRRDPDELRVFLARVERRDRFFNVRDVATYFHGRVRPGQLYRAPTLSRWGEREELLSWLAESGVTDVVDLRTQPEVEARPYPAAVSAAVRIHPVPAEIERPDEPPTLDHLHQILPASAALAEVVAVAQGAVVVHCAWGRDRTGWACALLLAAVGLPREGIVRDYLASRMGVRESTIRALLDAVEGPGAARALLEGAGVSPDTLHAVERRLLLP